MDRYIKNFYIDK